MAIDYQLVEIYSILPRVKNTNNSYIHELWRDGVTAYMEEYGLTGKHLSLPSSIPLLLTIFTSYYLTLTYNSTCNVPVRGGNE